MARDSDGTHPTEPNAAASLVSDFADVAELAARPKQVAAFLESVLDLLATVVPFDLATFLELEAGNLLRVKCARGPLASQVAETPPIALMDSPVLKAIVDRGDIAILDSPERHPFGESVRLPARHSCLLVPVMAGEEPQGLLTFQNRKAGQYVEATTNVVAIYGHLVGLGVAAARRAEELESYRRRLEEQNELLIEEVTSDTDACRALEEAISKSMRRLVQMAKQVAITDAPVLITGETGSGKEVTARAIHGWSKRSGKPFVHVNCAALPETLIESELFGHRRGAFSGAVDERMGRFRIADGGTLLLDEVGDLPHATQVKLLHVLQEGSLQAVGSDKPVRVDVRIIAATNVDLEKAIDEGSFREDLFYRLNVFPLHLPPLRDRLDDLPVITARILDRLVKKTGRGPWTVSDTALRKMRRYHWPGNVRELVNTLDRARVLSPLGGRLKMDLGAGPRKSKRRSHSRSQLVTLKQHEREYIERVLQQTGGKIYGTDGAAKILGIPPTTLQSKIERLGIRRQSKKTGS